jgi:signal transduction histidine kinase
MAVRLRRRTVQAVSGTLTRAREVADADALLPRMADTPGWVRDVGPALFAAAIQVGITHLAQRGQPEAQPIDAWAVFLLLAGPAALLLRRPYPTLCLVLAMIPTMAYGLSDYPRGPTVIALAIAFFNAVLRGRRRAAWGALGIGYLLVAGLHPALEDKPWPQWTFAAGLLAWLLLMGAGAELLRSRLERRAEEAAVQAEQARRRASDERLRIAQELHDVLAHNISLINVQAGVALHLLDERPEQARPALRAIRDASKDALGELRSVLDILRVGETAPRAPTAGLADLDALVARTRGTGLDVQVEVPETVEGLPAGVDLAAFRIVQEALTNVVRHAGATRATVRLGRFPDELVVEVDDNGHGPTAGPTAGDGGGRGLSGMSERARALGGSLDAGPRPGRGFRVRATLPLATETEGNRG